MRIFRALALFALFVLPASAQDVGQSEAGRIESVEFDQGTVLSTDGYVLHGGKTLALRSGGVRLLYPGDKIYVISPHLKVEYSLMGRDELEDVTAQNSPQTIPSLSGLRPRLCVILSCDLARQIQASAIWSVIPQVTRGHSEELNPVVPTTLLPVGDQYITSGTQNIAVIWGGGIGTARSGRVSLKSDRRFSILTGPSVARFNVSVTGQDGGSLSWHVYRSTEEPPLPEGAQLGSKITSDGDRLEEALFLLQPQYVKWHLYAISEISDLSEHSVTADLVWRQVVNGQYPPQK